MGKLLIVLLGLLMACVAPGQSTATPTPSDTAAVTPEELLRQSNAFGESLGDEERCSHLFRLAEAAGQLSSPQAKALTKVWARQLFRKSFDLQPSWNRAAFQKNALEVLSGVDPKGALKLLPKIDLPTHDSGQLPPEDLRAFAAQMIFVRLFKAEGDPALADIRVKANFIGRTGEYPYSAIAQLSKSLSDRKELGEVRQFFHNALFFYADGPHVRNANDEFLALLDADWPFLYGRTRDEALKTAVVHLTREERPESGVTHVARVATERGTAIFHGNDKRLALLDTLLPKIRESSKLWAEKLEEQYPELRQGGGKQQFAGTMRIVNSAGGTQQQVDAVAAHLLQINVLEQIKNESGSKSGSEHAIALLPSLTEPELQSEALAALATHDHERSTDFIDAAWHKADSLPAGMEKFNALVALAQSEASLRDTTKAMSAVRQGMELGEELVSEDLDVHPGSTVYLSESMDGLNVLTRTGAQIALEPTLASINQVRSETLQAYLLIAAAEGLQRGNQQ